MLLHKKNRKYTIVGLMQDEHKKLIPHVAPKLFKRYPSMTHMRDPLNAEWNRKLDEQLSAHELTELIDFSPLNLIFHNFLEVIGLPVSIIDSNARVLASSKWQRICSEFHRVNTRTLARCLECDAVLARKMLGNKPYVTYRCHNGLTDCVVPIVIENQHMANLFIGQFFLEPPDMDFFARQQEEFGFDKAAYFKALSEVPIVAEEKIPAILDLLSGLAHQIAQLSLAQKRSHAAYASIEQQVIDRTRQLQSSHELLNKLSSQVPGVIYQFQLRTDGTACVPYASDRLHELLGVNPEDVKDNIDALTSVIAPEDFPHVWKAVLESAATQTVWNSQFRVNLPGKGIQWREGTASPEKLPDNSTLWHGFIQDISERKRTEGILAEASRRLEELSITDALTGIANRRQFDMVLDREYERHTQTAGNLALIFIDIDYFKRVNDKYGHIAGDKCLRKVAHTIAQHMRPPACAARFGGEEFACILPNTELASAIALAEQIRRAIMNLHIPHVASGVADCVTVSLGVASGPCVPANSIATMVRAADAQLYRAKGKGRNLTESAFLSGADSA